MKNKTPLSRRCSVPGKVFLLGEYGVLSGGGAILTTVSPRFEGSSESFFDPFRRAGGLGASSARYLIKKRLESDDQVWELPAVLASYLRQFENSTIPPSGADLVAQMLGGTVFFDSESKITEDLSDPMIAFENQLLLFSTTMIQPQRKQPTDLHLQYLEKRDFLNKDQSLLKTLRQLTLDGKAAIQSKSVLKLGEIFTQYFDGLCEASLVDSRTAEDVSAFKKLPGFIGAKGSGARQSDLIVLLKDKNSELDPFIQLAEDRKLQWINRHFQSEPGLRYE